MEQIHDFNEKNVEEEKLKQYNYNNIFKKKYKEINNKAMPVEIKQYRWYKKLYLFFRKMIKR